MADSEGFDDFYRATSGRVLRYAFAMTGDQAAAQDVTQEAYIRAWRHWPRIGQFDNAEAWVRLAATRLATDRWRRLKVRRVSAANQPPRPVEPPSEDTVVLVAALRRLPPNQRQAICLHYLVDIPVAEVALEMNVAVGTVKSWLSRARTALATYLDAPAVKERHDAC